jgi:hypothetical protein
VSRKIKWLCSPLSTFGNTRRIGIYVLVWRIMRGHGIWQDCGISAGRGHWHRGAHTRTGKLFFAGWIFKLCWLLRGCRQVRFRVLHFLNGLATVLLPLVLGRSIWQWSPGTSYFEGRDRFGADNVASKMARGLVTLLWHIGCGGCARLSGTNKAGLATWDVEEQALDPRGNGSDLEALRDCNLGAGRGPRLRFKACCLQVAHTFELRSVIFEAQHLFRRLNIWRLFWQSLFLGAFVLVGTVVNSKEQCAAGSTQSRGIASLLVKVLV